MINRINLDGDLVAHIKAADCNGTYYTYADEYNEKYKADMVAFCKHNDLPIEDIEKRSRPKSKKKLHSAIDDMITYIVSFIQSHFELDEEPVLKVYLSDTRENNFRYKIAKVNDYKGNRNRDDKPFHLENAKHYLMRKYGAEIAEGMEADDALGINQAEDTIQATIDKDGDCISGWHFNWNHEDVYYLTEEEATHNFYIQLLTGDTGDNIKGIFRMGPKTAAKKVDGCHSHGEYYTVIFEEWKKYLKKENEDITDEEVEARILEDAQLLWIRRKENISWTPPV